MVDGWLVVGERAPSAAPATQFTPAQHLGNASTSDPLESTKCCACDAIHTGTAAENDEDQDDAKAYIRPPGDHRVLRIGW